MGQNAFTWTRWTDWDNSSNWRSSSRPDRTLNMAALSKRSHVPALESKKEILSRQRTSIYCSVGSDYRNGGTKIRSTE